MLQIEFKTPGRKVAFIVALLAALSSSGYLIWDYFDTKARCERTVENLDKQGLIGKFTYEKDGKGIVIKQVK